jgi:Zn-dependent protease with chaperone function
MEKLIGLQSTDYEHPLDKAALEKVRNNVAFRKIMTEFIRIGVEKMFRIQYTGSCLRIDKDDYPEIYERLQNAGDVLGMTKLPDLYMQYDYYINAFTTGEKEPLMVLHSGMIDFLEPAEQQYIVGHELGHILSHHVLYHMIVDSFVGFLDLGLLTKPIELALLYWSRMSELTADRAGLLACQDVNACIKAMIKMAGLPQSQYDNINIPAFIEQAHEFGEKSGGLIDESIKFISIAQSTHPWLVLRASELLKWIESGDYNAIINKRRAIVCPHCGNTIPAEPEICPVCGGKH